MTPLISKFLAHLLLMFWPQYVPTLPFSTVAKWTNQPSWVGAYTVANLTCNASGTTCISTGHFDTLVTGDAIVVFAYWDFSAGVTGSVSDTAGNVFTGVSLAGKSGGSYVEMFTAPVTALNSTDLVTLTISSALTHKGLTAIQLHNVTTPLVDVHSEGCNTGSATSAMSLTSLSVSKGNEFLLAGWTDFSTSGTQTYTTPWVSIYADAGYISSEGYNLSATSAGNYAVTATNPASTTDWCGASVAIKGQ